jgi:outer membrane protein assembly factor BamB
MKKNLLTIVLITLFTISTITPNVIGHNSTIFKKNKFLDDLNFINSFNNKNSKYDYLKKYVLNDFPDSDIVESEEINNPVETESIIMPSGGPMDSPWPMKCHDNRHTSQSIYSTVDNPYDEVWKFECKNMESSAVLDNNGIIYFGFLGSEFYALYPNGTMKWKYNIGWVWSTPAIAGDGTIYVGSWDTHLHAINPNGTRKWKFAANHASVDSSPAIAEDGTIYFGTMWSLGNGGKIYAVNPNGTEKWRYQTGWHISSDPAIGDDGTIYIGSGDKYLYAMNPNGTLKWRFKTGDEIHGHPSIAEDGTIYIGSYDDYLYALYPNGTMKWKIKLGYGTSGSPSIASDGTIYMGGDKLYAVFPNGTLKWSFTFGTNQHIDKSSPAISSEGIIYIGTYRLDLDGGFFIAINPDGTKRWSKKIANYGCFSSPAIGPDGTVYIGSSSVDEGWPIGYLYAFNRAELKADTCGPYHGLKDETLEFTGSAYGGYPPYSYYWDFGDTQSSDEQNPLHTYTTQGNYTITLTVTDDTGNTSDDYTWAWIQDGNSPPDTPEIDGPNQGYEKRKYTYTFLTSDPEGLQVWYYINWDDGHNTGWIGPYSSGESITQSHAWANPGTYTIKCKAKDPYDDESAYGELKITLPRDKTISNSIMLRFLERYPLIKFILEKFGL